MVFGNCGVLSEITPNKGFIEMSGIDPETSQDIGEVYYYDNNVFYHIILIKYDYYLIILLFYLI